MHEVSLIMALFDQIEQSVAPHPNAIVREVHVRVGELAGVEPQLLKTAFENFRETRRCAEASIALVFEHASWVCGVCGSPMVRGELLQCSCGGHAKLSKGGDVFLDRLEVEVPDV